MRPLALFALALTAAVAPAAVLSQAQAQSRATHCGYLNAADCEMEKRKQRVSRPGGEPDLRWNHSCPIYYPVRREGSACYAPGVETDGGDPSLGYCCTRLTAEEERAEKCRVDLTNLVSEARKAQGNRRSVARDRVGIRYGLLKDECARELGDIASQSGQNLPVRGASATPRASAALAESLGRRPGAERLPEYVDSGGTNDTAEYLFEILSFALGAASVVASAYQPRYSAGSVYGTRNPGRAPPASSYIRPAPRTGQSDITGTR